MTQDEIMEMAKEAHRKLVTEVYVGHMGQLNPWEIELLKIFANLVAAKERETYMQLFLDLENQPTQFGTATQEYRTQEIQEIQSLLTEIANIVRTKHIYGPEMKKLLAKEEAIRARG